MDNRLETYKIWAPPKVFWSQWAKPVLFATEFSGSKTANLEAPSNTRWIPVADCRTAVIVDLPDKTSVEEGLALARLGYRPVPLYNGVSGPSPIVNVRPIATALFKGADTLRGLSIRDDAPPAFLLDADRMKGYGGQPGTYDNRWCVFPQDMPSATCLLEHGIERVIVRSTSLQTDLKHVLRRYQDKGIQISLCDGSHIKPVAAKLRDFGSLMYRVKMMSGLKRNAAGGFGGQIPYHTDGGGGLYYGSG